MESSGGSQQEKKIGTDFNFKKVVAFEDYVNLYSEYKKLCSRNKYLDSPNNVSPSKSTKSIVNNLEDVHNLFVDNYGDIIARAICGTSKSGVMITHKKSKNIFKRSEYEYFSKYELGSKPEIEKILIEVDFLAEEANRLLRSTRLRRCLGLIYKIANHTLWLIDAVNTKNKEMTKTGQEGNYSLPSPVYEVSSETIDVLKHNCKYVREYHNRAARITAQLDYFVGNIYGFLLMILISILIIGFKGGMAGLEDMISNIESVKGFELHPLICIGLISGSIGAIISVMYRINSGSLSLTQGLGSRTIKITGIIRPIIGGVFGTILLILLNSGIGIVSIEDKGVNTIISNLIVLGFIAGFFERFVPDVLEQKKNRVAENEERIPMLNKVKNVIEEVQPIPSEPKKQS